MNTVLVCGDRAWTNLSLIEDALTVLHRDLDYGRLLHGAASGADAIAQQVAVQQGWSRVMAFPADWRTYGKAAGPMRNAAMLKQRPELVLAFHDNLDLSKGTSDCLMQARRLGITAIHLTSKHGGIVDALLRSFSIQPAP